MPVRIYDIAKKLGLENKEVITKAKELGISAAKVPSSSLDKITAEYLEQQIIESHPALKAKIAAPEPAVPPAPPVPVEIKVETPPPEPPKPEPAPVVLIRHEPAPETKPEPAPAASPAPAEPAEPASVEPQAPATEAAPAPAPEPPPAPEPAPAPVAPAAPPAPAAPATPPPPKVGQLVGRINLPMRSGPRSSDRGAGRPAGRPGAPQRDDRQNRPGTPPRGGQAGRGTGAPAAKAPPTRSGGPAATNIDLPEDAAIIRLKPPIVVRDLAEQLKQKPFVVIAELMQLGVFASVNQTVDEGVAQRVCAKFGVRFEVEKRAKGEGQVHKPQPKVEVVEDEDRPEDLKPRPPVVTIMGHVDHGKTTLLDVIRKSDVAKGEAGGITQHIGAYTISVPHPEKKGELQQITFLDTPGHAAFSSMRARGANVTDIVVLVVAANDGVMPQTLEALSHAKAAKVPIIVAVNKCDHPNANPMQVRQQLQDKGVVPDDWGGDNIFVDCSALTKQGVDKLLSAIVLQADLLELKANPTRGAKGNVIESGLEPGGPIATVLVRKGTLHVGDVILCGEHYGKARALINEEGKRLKEAGPSVAVRVLGLNGVPEAGIEFVVAEDEKTAREIGEKRAQENKSAELENRAKVTLENLFATLDAQQSKALKVIVKADTQGSVEAIVSEITKIESDKVTLEVVHSAVGTITESDVALAAASKAVILGFHTRIDTGVNDKAKHHGVQIKLYAIIYELVDEVKAAMAGLLEPVLKETTTGTAEVRKVFELSKGVPVAGCMVTNGRIVRGKVRVRRRKDLIYEGVTQSLRRFQDEVNEIRAGMECGIRIEGFGEFQEGDIIECYAVEKVAQKL
ncbi:MAG TPA: translation initiation factor IF-2 [Verrucomicrobiae bacterium]|nr:translation initiation factor IF-2 [Verrucomicrobiae bacterium]